MCPGCVGTRGHQTITTCNDNAVAFMTPENPQRPGPQKKVDKKP